MSNPPAPQNQQERKDRTTITIRRLTKAETPGVLHPSHGNSN
ncbi:hypothetical protein ACFFR3_23450 [Nonomuraea salmonea]|jgi:hypothetical protein|uniref:Uncharacterized protein n=1 Tax=Nonomuraea salmonea TaxID=46181 RepID=A0ABV5NQM9_9ACTN